MANVGEEGEGNLLGMRYLLKQSPLARRIQAFVVVDGANTDHITTRALGSRRFEATFSGPGGHSWSDFGVANPVHALCRAVALFAETRLDGVPKSAFNVGLIEGGSSVNTIAQSARAKVDIRSESNPKMDELVDLLEGAVERAREFENQRATGGRIASKLKEIGSRPAAALPEDAAILRYARAVDAHLGIRSHLDCSSTDANIPLSLGIPAIAIGAGGAGGGAHTSQEWFKPGGPRPRVETHFSAVAAVTVQHWSQEGVTRQRAAEAALVWNTVIWGATFVLVKAALDHVSTLLFLALRFSLATAALWWFSTVNRSLTFAAQDRSGSPVYGAWKSVLAGGLTGSFLFSGYLFQTLGLRLTTAPKSAFITGLYVRDGTFAGRARL